MYNNNNEPNKHRCIFLFIVYVVCMLSALAHNKINNALRLPGWQWGSTGGPYLYRYCKALMYIIPRTYMNVGMYVSKHRLCIAPLDGF